MREKSAVVVYSGGQDSTTCLLWAKKNYEKVYAVSFDYGQRHKKELECAAEICKAEGTAYEVIPTPIINELSANALTRDDIEVDEKKPEGAPPNTFVEGRNLLFLSYAAIYAKTHGITDIVTGVCETDFSGYPDCREAFIKAQQRTLRLALEWPGRIVTPFMHMSKAEEWALADKLGILDVIENETLTCYNGIPGKGCGKCPACRLRNRGYAEFRAAKSVLRRPRRD